jgi:hypothetical protein
MALRKKSDLTPSPALLGGFVRPHDFAGKRLSAQTSLAQRVDVLPVPIALFHQLALSARRFVKQARKGTALVLALVRELLLCGSLFVYLTLKRFDLALARRAAVGKLRVELIPFGFDLLQPAAKVLKVRPALLEQLLELVLRGQRALKRLHGSRRVVERLLDRKHPLTRVTGFGLRGGSGV